MNERIGILVPPPNTTLESELPRYAPSGVTFHWNRVARSTADVTVESLSEMAGNCVGAAETLSLSGVSMLVFACTSGSFIHGYGWDEELNRRLTEATGRPAITTSTAVVQALAAVGGSSISLATPYLEEITGLERKFLQENGFDVVSTRSLGLRDSNEIGMVSAETVARLGRGAYQRGCDVLFLSCTNLPTLDIIDELEMDLGVTVVSSNQATLWCCQRMTGRKKPFGRGGSLLR